MNDVAGSLSAVGIPEIYVPDERYDITITLRRPGLKVGGFQLSVRPEPGGGDGTRAGTIESADGRSEVHQDDHGQVAQHTRAGTVALDRGLLAWKLTWTAPRSGPVTFFITANASNDDDSPLGDFIYARKAESTVSR